MACQSTLPVINVVTTCANRKSATPHPDLLIRNLADANIQRRAKLWIERLALHKQNGVKVSDLYQGDHWATIRAIIIRGSERQVRRVNIWVASAGCGLLTPECSVPAYGATFSGGDIDSVVARPIDRREWWRLLTSSSLSSDTTCPRNITELAKRYPNSPMLVAGSAEYLDAMADDLLDARGSLGTSEKLTILCRKGAIPASLAASEVRISADLTTVLGGALISLNARVLKWLIVEHPELDRRSAIERAIRELSATAVVREVPIRNKTTDDEIKQFISSSLIEDRKLSGTVLLQRFRQSGRAAEQKRFRGLFHSTKEGVHIG
jgi:hypothetical protein